MINGKALRGIMASEGVSGADMAKVLDITPKTFYSKMKKGVFGSDEIETMVEVLKIENPVDLFFAKK